MAEKVYTRKFKFNPDKKPPTTKYYNQMFSGSFKKEFEYSDETQQARKDRRADSFKKWKPPEGKWDEPNNRVTRSQLEKEPIDQIGAVSSSWITSLGYNTATNEAVATFKGSSAEFYYKMSYNKFLDWLNSPSKGLWLHAHPEVMHDYTMRSGRGSQSMQDRQEQFHTKNRLKNRGDKKAMNSKIKRLREIYG